MSQETPVKWVKKDHLVLSDHKASQDPQGHLVCLVSLAKEA